MLTKVNTCAVIGMDGAIVEVEVDISPGLPTFTVVGLPDTAVQESRERVRAAIRNSGCEFPMRRITVNLAPADLRKEGPSYDLPIAVGILGSSGQLEADLTGMVFLGELSLEGQVRHTNGVLSMVSVARDRGFTTAAVPHVNAQEAVLVAGVQVVGAESLRQLVSHLRGEQAIPPSLPTPSAALGKPSDDTVDLVHIRGQEALQSILPPLTPEESLQVTKVYSLSGMLPPDTSLIAQRPFRAPHYTISNAGLVGTRFVGTALLANADMGPAEVWAYCRLDEAASGLAKAAMERLHLSARAFHRTLKVARTIADLAGAEQIGLAHLAEAFQYRQRSAE